VPDIALTLTDSDLLDWLEENRATVEFHPDDKPGRRWHVTSPGVNPFGGTDERLRSAISKAVSARERTLKQKEKRGQPPD